MCDALASLRDKAVCPAEAREWDTQAARAVVRLSFQLFLPSINRFLLRLLEIFVLRAHVNLYITGGGVEVAMDAHNDEQDAIVFQLEGQKR